MRPEADAAGPIISPAESDEHLAEIARLAGLIWRAHYVGIITPEQIEYMLERGYAIDELRDQLVNCGVSFDRLLLAPGDELIGFASYGPTGAPGELKLHKLYLHPNHQRRGYGSLLLEHVERAARRRGFRTVILAVNKKNDGAIKAYRRNGYEVREEVVLDIGGGFVMDDYVMAKQVGDA